MYKKQIEFFKNSVEGLKAKAEKAEGATRTEIENRIAETEAVVAELEKLQNAKTADAEAYKAIEAKVLTLENAMLKAKISEPKTDLQKVVNSASFANDFLSVVKNSETASDFRTNLLEMAEMKHGVKNDVETLKNLLPGYIVNEINDAFVGRRHRLLELIRWTNLPCYKALFETGNAKANHWSLEAAGYDEKSEQERSYTTITIRPKLIYKLAKIDRELEKAGSYNGDVLVKFIVAELLDRLLFSIERNILKGLTVDDETVFVAPKSEYFDYQSIPDARSYLNDTDSAIAVMNNSVFVFLKQLSMSTYNTIITDDMMAGLMGVQEIVITNSAAERAVFFLNVNDYVMVGDARPDQYENFNLSYNKKEYLMEMFVGGGCVNPLNFVKVGMES